LADTFLDGAATLACTFTAAFVAFLAGVFTSCLLARSTGCPVPWCAGGSGSSQLHG
jgi:hypothetical protein